MCPAIVQSTTACSPKNATKKTYSRQIVLVNLRIFFDVWGFVVTDIFVQQSARSKGTGMIRVFLAGVAMLLATITVSAQTQERDSQLASEVNGGTVGLISGGITGTYVRIASDLAAVLDDGTNLRILPMVGQGSVQNISDVLYLKGIDIGIVQADVLEFLKKQRTHSDLDGRLRYVTKLYNEEFHLIAGVGVRNIGDLRGKKVNFGNRGSGSYMTSSIIFNAKNVQVEPTSFRRSEALKKVKSGEIAAMVYVAGKPTRAFEGIKPEDGLHLVPVEYKGPVRQTYLPSSFSNADYVGLVPSGKTVPTVAVGAVMAVFNWKEDNSRYEKVSRFVNAFFDNFEEFQKAPRHRKWREVNISAQLPGWTRFKPAQSWLDKNKQLSATELVRSFKTFLAENKIEVDGDNIPADQREELFRQFIVWQQTKAQ